METLSKEEARRLLLERQGLARRDPFGSGEAATLKAVRRLGYVQIDTISVVERAQHHTLFNRNSSYRPTHLASLLEKRLVFEYWAHAAAYLPIESYRFCLPRMRAYAERDHWFPKDKKVMRRVFDQLRAEGPLKTGDIGPARRPASGAWYVWSPVKKALAQLFMEGKITVIRREGFQKVYGLMEDFLPSGVNVRPPSAAQAARFHVLSGLDAFGLATVEQLAYLRRKDFLTELEKVVRRMLKDGEIEAVRIAGLPETHYKKPGAAACARGLREARILSPFDNLAIQRKRLKDLFSFDYQIECYVPAPKRVYGYFSLPVLLGEGFVGRLDCKAHRKMGRFEVKRSSWEDGASVDVATGRAVRAALKELAAFNGCARIAYPRKGPPASR